MPLSSDSKLSQHHEGDASCQKRRDLTRQHRKDLGSWKRVPIASAYSCAGVCETQTSLGNNKVNGSEQAITPTLSPSTTPLQNRILEELSGFTYLTNSQLLRLGVSKNTRSLNRQLRDLSNKKYIRTIRYDGVPRRESFYCLTEAGARFVSDRLRISQSRVSYPKSTTGFDRDHAHRKLTIDFHIALVQWIRGWNGYDGYASHNCIHDPLSLPVFDRYFDVTGANRTYDPVQPRLAAKTRVKINRKERIIPDVNFIVRERMREC